MGFLQCNVTDDSKGQLTYEKPFNRLIMSKQKGGGILIRSVQYMEANNKIAFESDMFFFDDVETEILFEWLAKELSDDQLKRIYEKLLTKE